MPEQPRNLIVVTTTMRRKYERFYSRDWDVLTPRQIYQHDAYRGKRWQKIFITRAASEDTPVQYHRELYDILMTRLTDTPSPENFFVE